MSDLFKHTIGPKDAKIAIVGEAWGEEEEKLGIPFMGQAGQELSRMLSQAGLDKFKCFCTNVFNLKPAGNKIESLCAKKAEVGKDYKLLPLSTGNYILEKYLPEVERLKAQLTAVNPNLVIALGNTACWALLSTTRISSIRGTLSKSTLVPTLKVLPTYHPAAVLRNWSLRPITIADFIKAKRQADFPEIRRPRRTIIINPTLDEIKEWAAQDHQILSVDIETKAGQITCIGFARSISDALVIPFFDESKVDGNYWTDPFGEHAAWNLVGQLLEHPAPKLFQNGLYDMQYILRMGFKIRNVHHDTMLLHHALYPEMPKGLGFMGSIHTDEPAWKLMREKENG